MSDGMKDSVLLEKRDGLGIITLNRPEKANAMRLSDYELYARHVRECDEDPEVRVILITGAGDRYFTVGDDATDYASPDITRLRTMSAFERQQFEYPNVEAGWRLWNSTKASIVAINGACMMPEFLWWADLRVMADTATIAENQVSIGVTPSCGGTQVLTKLVGRARAMQVLLLGERIGAAEAVQLGLVHAVVSPADLMTTAEGWAQRMMKSTAAGIAMTRLAVNAAVDTPLEWGMRLEKFGSYTSELAADIWSRTEEFVRKKEGSA